MRFFSVLMNDIRYQIKYGFYFLNAFISAIYITVLLVTPSDYKSLVADVIILIGIGESTNHLLLSVSVFAGSFIFTTFGLLVTSYARSVNNYIFIGTPVAILLSTPPILAVFGISYPVLEVLPGTALWRVIGFAIGMTDNMGIWLWFLLVLWLGIAVVL